MKPAHFREVHFCCECTHCKLTYHHCSACRDNDEYTCTKHDFLVSEYEQNSCVCDDFEVTK